MDTLLELLGNFIKDIILIIENDKILNTDIGIKKKKFQTTPKSKQYKKLFNRA